MKQAGGCSEFRVYAVGLGVRRNARVWTFANRLKAELQTGDMSRVVRAAVIPSCDLPNHLRGVAFIMKTIAIATFNELTPAELLVAQFQRAGVNAVIHDESKLERFWFMSEPLAAIHVDVPQPDYLRARRLMIEWEKSGHLMKAAVRCPDCRSSRVEFPQFTRKFLTPALCQMVLTAFHVLPREYYCQDCHFTWSKVPAVEPELDILGFPLNSKFWHPERFPKQTK